ncbi:DNA repair protein endonuclease SAE2/CtIP C-terminus-domain-containing protein [Mycena galericulata]|nr:DNA repair protein endonuclease SAE2/CtIP C-terminus-domain-containing protein [Mycena galericulata]
MQVGTTQLREDPRVREKFLQEEITHLNRKVGIARDTVSDLQSKIWDLEGHGSKLAKSLGFETVHEAQAFADSVEGPTTYKELQSTLARERNDNNELRAELLELRIERNLLRAKVDVAENCPNNDVPATSDVTILRQLHDLQRRYDELQTVKQRAEDKYKAGYRKFEALKAYLRSEDIQAMENHLREQSRNLSKNERRHRQAEINSVKAKKIQELEAAEQDVISVDVINDRPTTAEILSENKENQQTPVPDPPKRHISVRSMPIPSLIGVASLSNTKLPLPDAPPLAKTSAASWTPSFVVDSGVPHCFQPGNDDGRVKQQSLASTMYGATILIPSSSDTEEDPLHCSNSFSPFKIPSTLRPVHPEILNPNSSETEDDSQDPYPSVKIPPVPAGPTQDDRKSLIVTSTPEVKPQASVHPSSLPSCAPLQLVDQCSKSKTRRSDGGANPSARGVYVDEEPPRKLRRVSSPGPGSGASLREPGASAAMPLYVGSGDTPRRKRDRGVSASTGRRAKPATKDREKAKPKEFKLETMTPAPNAQGSSSKDLADYSTYKGRGRYARDGTEGNTTINAKFAIDPAQNEGRYFQYDEVVRGREDRRHLEAEDCECCRDYYNAIGPMPNRLQPPLWRTPPGSPSNSRARPCLQNGSVRKESADITSHKQAISRHRHQWARAQTPPAYWSIGFPSTQDAADINQKAREMHQQKEMLIQEEANRDGGRYKKR